MVSRRLIQKRRVAMQGKAEKRMSQGLLLLGCFLSLRGYGGLAVSCWVAGVAWKRKL